MVQQPGRDDNATASSTEAHSCWRERYAATHRLERIHRLPEGIAAPRRVRIYRRREHFVLQWWDKREKRTLNERIDGDLLAALSRSREIDERLEQPSAGQAGTGKRRVRNGDLVDLFLRDLARRADAGEIDVATADRYASALRRHYLPFVMQPHVSRRFPCVETIDRTFQLEFAAYLHTCAISPNGHANSRKRPMKQPAFVLDVVRAMLEWAADPERGGRLPEAFRNRFARRARVSHQVAVDPLSEPDITLSMAADLIEACDRFQLTVFAPLLLYGLRPGELGWIFREHLAGGWLRVPCNLDLDYVTKGRRQKAFPVVDGLAPLWQSAACSVGLLYVTRAATEGRRRPPLLGLTLPQLVDEYRRRCSRAGKLDAKARRKLRSELMKQAGQLGYDQILGEFRRLSRALGWPAAATLKDLRHLFATSLEDAGVPEFYRRYLMGQSFGRAPIVAYTHVSEEKVRQHYTAAVETELAPVVRAIEERSRELGIASVQDDTRRDAQPRHSGVA